MAQPQLKIVDRHLFEVSDDLKALQDMLEDGDIDPTMLADTLEAIDTEFELKAHQVAIVISNISAPIEAINAQIARLQAKEKSITNKAESLRNYLRTNMERLGKTKIDGEIFNITLAKGRASVVVDNLDSIPDEYVSVKTTTSADKTAIKKAIDSGFEVTGAHIEIGQPSLRIK